MNTRIKEVRLAANLSQSAFGEALGLSQNYIWMIETGKREPSDRTIRDICREYDVNENWLRTGEGEMKRHLDRNEQISKFVGDVLTDVPGAFRKRFVSMLSAMTPEEWALLEQMAKRLIDEKEE